MPKIEKQSVRRKNTNKTPIHVIVYLKALLPKKHDTPPRTIMITPISQPLSSRKVTQAVKVTVGHPSELSVNTNGWHISSSSTDMTVSPSTSVLQRISIVI
jgi:hypothetical protein